MANDIKALLPDLHSFTTGTTGTGKTFLSVQLHKASEVASIFFNPPDRFRRDYSIPGLRADMDTPKKALKKALMDRQNVVYEPHRKKSVAKKELRGLWELCQEVRGSKGDKVRIHVDEVQRFAHQRYDAGDEDNIIVRMAEEGRGSIRLNGISQKPQKVVNEALSEMHTHYIGALADSNRQYIKAMGMDWEKINSLTDKENYIFVKYDVLNSSVEEQFRVRA